MSPVHEGSRAPQTRARRVLTPTADHPYFLWQALVHAVWAREHDWQVSYLVYHQGSPSPRLQRLAGAGLGDWHVWRDWRPSEAKSYNAAMKPWLVGKHLAAHPELVDESLLICDPDALPLRPWPDAIPGVLLGTDTDSYTGPGYLKSKGAWEPLCSLVGVHPDVAATLPGMGAQYVTTGLPGSWWEHVAEQSVAAFQLMRTMPAPAGDPYPVQAWCAEMYVTQLAAIRDGIEPRIAPEMGMVWANGPRAGWESEGFFHDAGQQEPHPQHFCKISHQVSPFGCVGEVDPESSSAPYVDLIRRTATAHPDLVW